MIEAMLKDCWRPPKLSVNPAKMMLQGVGLSAGVLVAITDKSLWKQECKCVLSNKGERDPLFEGKNQVKALDLILQVCSILLSSCIRFQSSGIGSV